MIRCYKAATSTVLTKEELLPPFAFPFLIIYMYLLFYIIHAIPPLLLLVRGKKSVLPLRNSRISCFSSKLSF